MLKLDMSVTLPPVMGGGGKCTRLKLDHKMQLTEMFRDAGEVGQEVSQLKVKAGDDKGKGTSMRSANCESY